MTIRKRRRDRTRRRLESQKRLDAIASEQINKSFLDSTATWGGRVCPECFKSVPSRAFVSGYELTSIDRSCIITVGAHVAEQYCHSDVKQCMSESAKEDKNKWMMSPLFIDSQFNQRRKNMRDRARTKAKENYQWRKSQKMAELSAKYQTILDKVPDVPPDPYDAPFLSMPTKD